MKKFTILLAAAMMLALPQICQAKKILFKAGTGQVEYTCQNEPFKGRKVIIYYHIPEGNIATMPVQFVMHGDNRNGDSYRDAWIKKSDEVIDEIFDYFVAHSKSKAVSANVGWYTMPTLFALPISTSPQRLTVRERPVWPAADIIYGN